MSIMEMLCMHPVYVGPESVKDTCLSKLCMGGFYSNITDDILFAKLVDPRVASSMTSLSLQSVGFQHSVLSHL